MDDQAQKKGQTKGAHRFTIFIVSAMALFLIGGTLLCIFGASYIQKIAGIGMCGMGIGLGAGYLFKRRVADGGPVCPVCGNPMAVRDGYGICMSCGFSRGK